VIDRARMADLAAREASRFRAERPRSLALAEAARRSMPNAVPMAWMAGLYSHPPVFAAEGSGAWFSDVDGNRYLDMNQADLSMSCGYGPPAVVEAVARQMARGSQFLLPTEDATAVSELLAARFFGLPFWQYTLSASQANVEAIRLARLATGREEVLLFDGKYHGHIDDTLVALHGDAVAPEGLGLPGDAGRRSRVVPFNDLHAAEVYLWRGTVACVVTEPALTNVGVILPDPGYLEGLRTLCTKYGTLLVLDETHTQICAFGGLTRAWGLEPDIVTIGKTIGGGVALGAYGMTEALARVVERNLESDIEVPGLAIGGTLFGNALSLAAARAALTEVMTEAAYARTAALGARLADGIQAALDRHGLPWAAQRLYARSGYSYARSHPRTAAEARAIADPALTDLRRLYMANRGVWEAIATAGPAASFPMVEADIDVYLEVLEAFLGELAG
jgi:glutamate-1-semialdehyde 2,1-aminomutase